MKILRIAFIALAVVAPFASASAGRVNRSASESQRQFVARMAAAPAPAERGLLGPFEPGENSSTSVNWRRIGGF
ncbi:hypothetical protein [Rhodoblastus sp.]|jgi:hypothetical protein|uniref:hypothetical protein n=1 Tax=Rhodoblastus sp. TaxID=1962975 RepID=UPI0025FA5987|nr:hypothetical protein [Rhodoblastus sp.]